MAKFLIKATYTLEGLRGVAKDGGSSRADVVRKMVEGLGGHMETFYFAFGEDDVFVICDLPDTKTAAAVAFTVGAAGGANTKTVTLLTPEEVDAATRQVVDYTAPGQ